jgi:hypothetical protein
LLLSRLDALALEQRWSDIDNLLGNPNLTLDPSVLECFRARTAQEKGAALDAEMHWNHALSFSANDAAKLRFVANFAEQSHANGIAIKAFDQLAKFPEETAFAFRGTQRLSAQAGQATAQRAAAEKIATLAPDDPNAAAQFAYLSFLVNTDVEANLKIAKDLADKYPDRLSYRVTAALGYLRQNDVGMALAQFKGPANAPPIDWQKTPAAWRAVYAASLMAGDQSEAALNIIRTIPLDKLNKEERALIQPTMPK